MVLEIPPAERVRSPAASTTPGRTRWRTSARLGADKGKGGKYLILPPGYQGACRTDTWRAVAHVGGFAILRSNLKSGSDADIAKAVAYGKRVKIYPLAGGKDPTTFVDAYDVVFDTTIPYDGVLRALDRRAGRALAERDKVMID